MFLLVMRIMIRIVMMMMMIMALIMIRVIIDDGADNPNLFVNEGADAEHATDDA